jgi:hypothetical protein
MTRLGCLLAIAMCATALAPAIAAGESAPPAIAPVNTSAPSLAGTPAVGQTLTCSTGGWANYPSSFGYQWLRDGSPIAGQTASTYLVQSADRSHSLSCRVTASVGAGEYTIIGLPTGAYKVTFHGSSSRAASGIGDYMTTYFHQELSLGEANPVEVTAGEVTSGIDAIMPAGGEISGRVLNAATHAGVEAVGVCAEAEGRQEGCVVTNAAGEYTISGLPTGSYRVWFTAYSELHRLWSWSSYYDGKSTQAEANLVPVSTGYVTTGIDVEIPAGQISGTVTGAAGHTALDGIEVCARLRSVPPGIGCALTNAAGEYTIANLSAGSYEVQFAARAHAGNYVTQYYRGVPARSEATEVAVAAGSTTAGIDAELQTGGEISGTVTSASAHTPLEGTVVCAESTAGIESGPCTSTDNAGEYTLVGLGTSSYYIGFSTNWEGASSDYLGDYFSDKTSRGEATPVAVTAGSVTSGIDAQLQLGGQLTGTVTSAATGAGVEKIVVCADDTTGLSSRCANTDVDGQYTISGVQGNSVRVKFTRYPEGGNYLSQLYSGQLLFSTANLVPVAAGSVTAGIDAQLLTGGEIVGQVTNSAGAGIGGITVCAQSTGAFSEAFSNQIWGSETECAVTAGAGGSTGANSNTLEVPGLGQSQFKLVRSRFDSNTDELDFFVDVNASGYIGWKLFFKDAAIGLASPKGPPSGDAVALANAPRHGGQHRHQACRQGDARHDGHCLPALAPFSSGSRRVSAGTVEIEVRPDAKARKALNAGRTLHVSGTLTFQPSPGGTPVAETVSTSVRKSKRAVRQHEKGRRR